MGGALGRPQGISLSYVLIITFLALLWTADNKPKDKREGYCHNGLAGAGTGCKGRAIRFPNGVTTEQ